MQSNYIQLSKQINQTYIEKMEQIIPYICNRLNIYFEEAIHLFQNNEIKVLFEPQSGSWYDNGTIHVSEHIPPNWPLTPLIWFELLFSHELVHALTDKIWKGEWLSIFLEGLPVYISDHSIRKKALNLSYHEQSRALLVENKLLRLEHIIMGANYFNYRTDWRIDIQSGSFVGFLIENYGMNKLKAIVERYSPPTPKKPYIKINHILEDETGIDLSSLENIWKNFLLKNVKENNVAYKKVLQANFNDLLKTSSTHCQYCYHPLKDNLSICPSCKGDNTIELHIV